MSLTKKVAHNTIIQIIGKTISTVLGLLSLALITRYLGRDGFGVYTTVITFLTFFAVASDFGLTLVTVQMISGQTAEEGKILNNLFGFRLISAFLFLAIAPLTVIFFPYSAAIKFGVMIAFISFLFPALNQVIIGLFQKKLDMSRDAVAETIGRLILLAGIILTEKFSWGLNGLLVATVISAAINFLSHYLLARKFTAIKAEFDWLIWKKIFSKSWPLAITIVLNLIYLRADTLILSLLRSEGEVGLYGATYRIIDVLTTIPFMFAGLILPIMTAAWAENNHSYFHKVLQKSFDFMAILAIPLIIGTQFLGQPVMLFAAGRDFAPSGAILRVLIFAVAAIFLGTMFSHAVIALDRQKKMIGLYLFTSLSSLIAYFILIARFSYFGAAAVTIYSETLIAFFSAYCVWKYSRFRPNLKITLKAIISGLVMGVSLYFLTPLYQNTLGGVIFVIFVASLLYFLVLYLLGGIKKEDIAAVLRRSNKSSGPSYGGPTL
jgi:O-antigen/teichoic acid export membrane protein